MPNSLLLVHAYEVLLFPFPEANVAGGQLESGTHIGFFVLAQAVVESLVNDIARALRGDEKAVYSSQL